MSIILSSTQILVIDHDTELLLATLSNKSRERANYYDAYHTEQLNGDNHFEFRMLADHPDSFHVVAGNYVGFKDLDGIIQLFQIYKTEEVSDGSRIYKYIYAEHCFYELLDDIIISVNESDITAEQAVQLALANSRWQVGTVANLGLSFIDYHYNTAISCLQQVANRWGGELQFRVVLGTNGQILGRYVDLLTRRGSDTGKRFQFTHDLASVQRNTNVSNLKTALYGRGAAVETTEGGLKRKIDFKDIVWSVANGDPVDKPAGQDWIGDPEALSLYGRMNGTRHRFGVFEDGRAKEPEILIQLTWEKLQELNKPGVTYQTDVINLEEITGLPHDRVRLGDTVQVIDVTFYPAIRAEARIFELKRAIDDPEKTHLVLGNFIEMYPNVVEKKLRRLEQELADNSGIWDRGGENAGPIDVGDWPDIVPNTPVLTADGAFSKIILSWNMQFDHWMQHYEVYGSTTPNFTLDSTNLLFRGLVSSWVFDAGTGQQYYFRVRGVNKRGTAGGFSNEATASTAKILTDDILFGAVNAEILADLAVEAAKLADQAVTAEKIANLAVGNAAIQNLAVTAAKIAALAVQTAHIQDLAVTNAKIGNLAVDTAKIADLAVTSAKVALLSADKITVGGATTYESPTYNPAVKKRVFNTTPSPPYDIGDLWTQGASGDIMVCIVARASGGSYNAADWEKAAKYTDDSSLSNYVTVTTYNTDLDDIRAQLDQSITSWFYDYDPTMSNEPASLWTTETDKATHLGDTFTNSDTGYSWRFGNPDGVYQWIAITDSTSAQALQMASEAQDTADGKRRVFVATPTPPYDVGDLWAQGPSGDIMVCKTAKTTGTTYAASDWEVAAKYTDDAALANYVTTSTYNTAIGGLQTQIDGKIETWFLAGIPTLVNAPASTWTDNPTKDKHLGDLYYDTTSKKVYRFRVVTGTYSWELLQDADIQTALTNASTAQTTADSKMVVFTSQPTTPYDIGDLWSQGATGDLMKCKVARTSGAYVAADWEKASKYTDDTTANLKKRVFVNTPTTPYDIGDLWAQGSSGHLMVCKVARPSGAYTAADWEQATKYTDDGALANYVTNSTYSTGIGNLQTQLDGKVETWFYSGVPTLANNPATLWTDNATKDIHLGDLYFDTATKKIYRFKVDTGVYSWEQFQDSDIQTALTNAATAQITADNKAVVFTSQPATPYDVGDLWVQGTSGDIMRCQTARASGAYTATDWVKASKYTDDSLASVKRRVFTSTPTTPYELGDLWAQGASGDLMICTTARATGSYTAADWSKAAKYTDDAALANYVTTTTYNGGISGLQTQLDGKIETWFLPGAPTLANAPASSWTNTTLKNNHLGDLYFDTTTKKVYHFKLDTGVYSWQLLQDTDIQTALTNAANAQSTADGKMQVFTSEPIPPYDLGDLWSGGPTGDLMVCKTARPTGVYTASDWQKASKYTDDAALANYVTSSEYTTTIGNLEDQIDGKAETWFYSGVPTLANAPASSWTTNAIKDIHLGDLYFDTTSKKVYRFRVVTGTYSWELLQDSDIQTALTNASTAQSTADSKMQVFVTQPVTPYDIGDLWVQGTTGDLMRCQTAKASGVYSAADWVKAVKYTDDSSLANYVTTSTYTSGLSGLQTQIDGKIETWFLAGIPTLTNAPASSWADTGTKDIHLGDLYFDTTSKKVYRFKVVTGVYSWELLQDTDIQTALTNASTAQSTADSKMQVFSSQPTTPYDIGDLWVQGTTGDLMVCKVARASGAYDASDWGKAVKYTDDASLANYVTSSTYNTGIGNLQSQIDGKIETWFLAGIPTLANAPASSWTTNAIKDVHLGDLYYDTTSKKVYRFRVVTGTYSWELLQDSDIQTALTNASTAQSTADSKMQVFVAQPVPPYDIGDLWVQGTTGDLMRCQTAKPTGTYAAADWVKAVKYTDDSSLANYVTSATYNSGIGGLQTQIDGKVETWFLAGAPTLANAPASSWTTNAIKDVHLGDLYYDTTSKKVYRFRVVTGVYSWELMQDSDIQTALTNASTAQSTADSKMVVFTSQPTTPYDIGDLWAGGPNGDLMKCKVARASGAYVAADWEKASKYTDDTAVNNLVIGGRNILRRTDFSKYSATSRWGNWNSSTQDAQYTDITLASGEVIKFLRIASTTGLPLDSIFGQVSGYTTDTDKFKLVAGKEYTLSFLVAAHTNSYLDLRYTYILNDDGGINQQLTVGNVTSSPLYGSFTVPFALNVYKHKVTFTATYTTAAGRLLLGNRTDADYTGTTSYGVFYVALIKLEEGSKATGWTPAPEDIQGYVDGLDTKVREDLNLVSALPTEVTLSSSGVKAATTADPNKYAILDHRGLYIKGGAIQIENGLDESNLNPNHAAALNMKPNMVPDGYDSFSRFALGDTTVGVKSTSTTSVIEDDFYMTPSKSLKCISTVATGNYVFFSPSTVNYNIPTTIGKNYIFSCYVLAPAGNVTNVKARIRANNGGYYTTNEVNNTISNSWVRVSTLFTASQTTCNISVWWDSTNALWLDCLQIEEVSHTNQTLPSPWVPTGFSPVGTYIDSNGVYTGSITFNQGQGGTLTLGGTGNQNGRLIVLNDIGEQIADLDAEAGGFDKLYVGDLVSPTVVQNNRAAIDYSLYVNTSTGNDNTGTGDISSPFKTVNRAIDAIPKYTGNNINVSVRVTGNTAEKVEVIGFSGAGAINFFYNNTTLTGSLYVAACSGTRINFYDLILNNDNIMTYGTIQVYTSSYVLFQNVRVYSRSIAERSLVANDNAFAYAYNCEFYDAKESAIRSAYFARVMVGDCRGKGNTYGIFASYGGQISGWGTTPGGNTASNDRQANLGGRLFGDGWTTHFGAATPPTPPPPTEQTKSIGNTGGDNWSALYNSWQGSADGVKQGNYGYGNRSGLWFFGPNILNNIGSGKTITRIRLYVTRANESGASAGQRLSVRAHGYQTRPAGAPTLSGEIGTVTLARGQGGWVEISSSVFASFASGAYNGFGIFTSDGSQYLQCTTGATVEVTYR